MNSKFAFFSAILLLPSCAGTVRGALAEAPEWYDKRRVEIRGEGYPDLTTVRAVQDVEGSGHALQLDERKILKGEFRFRDHERSQPSDLTPAEILETQQALLTRLAPANTEPDILTQDEIDALKAIFDNYSLEG